VIQCESLKLMLCIVAKRPVTRLPYPVSSQVRYVAIALTYRALRWVLAPVFRRRLTLGDLSGARILVLKPCCLGDVVFSTPLLRELRRTLPTAHLTFGVGSHSRPAIANHPAVDEVLDTGRVGSGPYSFRDYVRLIRAIRVRRFDACFVLERSAVLHLIPLLAGVPFRVGIDSGGRGFSLAVAVSSRPARPESELYLDLLRALGGQPHSGELEYHPSDQAVRRIDHIVREQIPDRRPFVVLHCAGGANPGMTLLRKRWPIESFRALAERIVGAGGTVVLVGSAEDRDALVGFVGWGLGDGAIHHPSPSPPRAMGRGGDGATVQDSDTESSVAVSPRRRLAASAAVDGWTTGPDPTSQTPTPVVDLVGQLSLDELAELARRAVAYVGNDSGPSHLAEAAGANVVMLFGPSDPIMYGPRCSRGVAVTAGLWCSPCFESGRVAPCANVICMQSISVDRVWREVRRFMTTEETVR
jgi:ADP-heptose:LPS heptosyltransferase